jgi:alpha-glucosidase
MHYAVDFRGKWLMDESVLGLKIQGQPALGPGMKQVHAVSGHVDESYSIPVGKTSSVRDHYNSARVDFEDPSGRKLAMEVRAFDDGVAFRYIVPQQSSFANVRIEQELTEFRYPKDATLYRMRTAKHTVDLVRRGSLKVSGIVSCCPCGG